MSDEGQPLREKSQRGFASLSPERRRELGSMGGKAVAPKKRAFSKSPKLAKEAGEKGRSSPRSEGRSFDKNRALAQEAGRKGGVARWAEKRAAAALANSDTNSESDT